MYVVLVSSIATLAKRNNAEFFDGIEVLIYCSLALLFDNVHKSDYVRARVLGEPFKVITKDKSTEKHLRELSSIIASIQQISILYNEAMKDG